MTVWKRAVAATMLVAGLCSCASTGSAGRQATSPPVGSSGPGSTSPHADPSGSRGTSPAANPSGPASPSPAAGSSRPGSPSPGGGSPSRSSASGSTSPAGTTSVPDVDSQPVPDALQLLQQNGLIAGAQEQKPNLYVPYMSVITSDPAVGTSEPHGFAVTLLVSAGPPSCQECRILLLMPPLIGDTLNEAITTLAEGGLSLQSYTSQPAPEPAGEVIASDPGPGLAVDRGTGIKLVLSSGPAPPGASPTPGLTPSGS